MAAEPIRTASQADFTLKVEGLDAEELHVLGFDGTEAVSELFGYHIDFACANTAIAFDAVLGKSCLLEVAGPGGSRFVHGMICRFRRTGQGGRSAYYALDVVPLQWLLTRRIGCRIFQEHMCSDMTAPGIIKKVFKDAGLPDDSYRLAIQGTYEAHEYVVQYRESEWALVSRIMEEEGIFYFFEHTAEGHKLVLADSAVAHVASPLDPECVYREPTGLVPVSNSLYALRESAELSVAKVVLDDFNFTTPGKDLRIEAAGSGNGALRYGDYPGGYGDTGRGKRLAQVRLEEWGCGKQTISLAGDIRGLAAGQKFTLAEHPVSDLNREYLVTHAGVRARQPQGADQAGGQGAEFDLELRVIPADVPFRAPRGTPRPFIGGAQTALVVGPSGEEIYTDKYGRVKVQFHWDSEGTYTENSSCWVRVSQGAAGGQYGMMFLPRVGQEVIVSFLEGDPDQPIVTGRVFNNDQMPPYTLPDNKTRSVIKTNSSTGGGGTNEFMFEDLKDSEKILLFAQKDLHVRVKHDRVDNVENDWHQTVKQHKFELIEQKAHSEVKLDRSDKVGGKASLNVTGDQGVEVGGNASHKITGKLYLKSDDEIVIEAASGITLKVGGNFVKIDSSSVAIKGTAVNINSGGSASSGSAVALNAPEATIAADTAAPGADKTYSATAVAVTGTAAAAGFAPVEIEPAEPVPTSWVEIEMVDEDGQPWAGEYFELTMPDGKIREGYLNEQGQAHVLLPTAAQTQVSFPKLDSAAWEKSS